MMEREYFKLDLEIFAQLSGEDFTSATTARRVQLEQPEEDEEKLKTEFTFINSAIITQVLHKPDSEHFIKSMYRSRLDEIQKELPEKLFMNILVKLYNQKLCIAPYVIYSFYYYYYYYYYIYIYIYIQIF